MFSQDEKNRVLRAMSAVELPPKAFAVLAVLRVPAQAPDTLETLIMYLGEQTCSVCALDHALLALQEARKVSEHQAEVPALAKVN